jgi:hypothetical protein
MKIELKWIGYLGVAFGLCGPLSSFAKNDDEDTGTMDEISCGAKTDSQSKDLRTESGKSSSSKGQSNQGSNAGSADTGSTKKK